MRYSAATRRPQRTRARPERFWNVIANNAGELHIVPADEPHEWSDDCWCLPEWESYIEAFGRGACHGWADTLAVFP